MFRTSPTQSAKNLSLLVDVAEDAEVGVDDGDRKDGMVERSPRFKNLNGASYLTPKSRLAFTQLRKAFTKAPILWHFDPECHIRIETNGSGYAIGRVLSQLTSNDLGRWHLVAYFSQKMILAKTCYKTHNGELLAIVEAFKTWRHYLKGCKYKVLILTDHNNLQQFMDTKSLSSCQVCWAQKLFYYHFWIDYYQDKANKAADALFCFLRRSLDEEEKLQTKNIQIFYRLQTLLTKASFAGLSLSGLSASSKLLPLHQVFICETHDLPQLCDFWDTFHLELVNKGPYKVSIGSMQLWL